MLKKLYVICSSHMDPVWLWRRTSGCSTWLNTTHSVVRMMEKHPELKFSCSAIALYRFVEECAPALFRKIQELVRAGRWEIVGGWEVQSDAIVADAESLIRQGLSGQEYVREKFGVEVKVGFSVDAFGHAANLPKILNLTGMTHYVFMRPQSHETTLPLLFDWQSEDGSQVRALRIFDSYNYENCSKAEYLERIRKHLVSPLPAQTLFFGAGDHGGGIYETHLEWLNEAAAQFGFEIQFATLAEYFDAVKDCPLPVVKNTELGPVFRGCYAACQEMKNKVAEAMRRMLLAERCGTPEASLAPAWRELLFQHFHDSLSGTATLEAYEKDVFPALGGVTHQADECIRTALHRRAESMDTAFLTEGGVYLWNPQSVAVTGVFSFPGFSDPNETGTQFNALLEKDGTIHPLQVVPNAPSTFGPCGAPWGMLTSAMPMRAGEEKVLAYAKVPPERFPNVGFARQRALLPRISFPSFFDDCGTWGFTLSDYLRPDLAAELVRVEEFVDGPVVSILRAYYRLAQSEIRIDVYAYAEVEELQFKLRIDWHEKLRALKLAIAQPFGDRASFHTGSAAGLVSRYQPRFVSTQVETQSGRQTPLYPRTGEICMQEWCAVQSEDGKNIHALITADLHSCDYANGAMRVTLVRATPYADHHPFPRNEETGFMDMDLTFRELWFAECPGAALETLPNRARRRLQNVEAVEITAHEADPAGAALPEIRLDLPECVVLEAARQKADGKWEYHLQNYGTQAETVTLPDCGSVTLPPKSYRIF